MTSGETPGPAPPGPEEQPAGATPTADEGAAPKRPARRRQSTAHKKHAGAAKKPAAAQKPAAGGAGSAPADTSGSAGAKPPRKRAPRKAAAAKKPAAAAPGVAAAGAPEAVGAAEAGPPEQTAVTVPDATGASAAAAAALAPVGRFLTSRRAPRLRTGIAAFLVVASVLAVMVSALALWSRGIVFDTETYVRVVAPVAEDPQVREAVSEYVAARAVQATDLDARIEDALPSDAKILAPTLTGALQRFLVDEIDRFLSTELAQRLWVDINRFAHRQLITALRDQNRYVTVGRNDVKLNLLPLVAVALQRLEDRIPQLLGRDVTLPRIDPATAPDEIKTLLQDALGRELPADFGTITLLHGDQGYEAKQALRLFNDLVVLVVVLTVILIVAALLVSVRRWRTALWLGFGSLFAFVAARVIEVQLEKVVVDAVKTQGGAAVARAILGSAVESLNAFFIWVAVAGVIVVVAAVLAGRPSWLQAIGRGVAELFGVASDLSTPDTRAGRWMAAHLDLLRIAGVAVAVVVLLFVTSSLTAVIVVIVALAVYELALSAYGIGVPRELDDDHAGEPPPAA